MSTNNNRLNIKAKEMIQEVSNLDVYSENETKTRFIQRKICKEICDLKEKHI